ncbi:unnamed protein product [Rhizophagus irregularis]|nr:unnamed protein product [Rhizophagus irregularis]
MLRNKHRKANIATLPFRIRNNFRRLPNRFSQPQDVILSDNDSIETMLQDFEDGNVNGEEHNNDGDNHDYLEQRGDDDYFEQSDDDHLGQRSDLEQYEESDYLMMSSESDYLMSSESNYLMSSESDYLMSSESDEDYATSSLDDADTSSEERLFVDAALAEDKLPSFDGIQRWRINFQ